MLPDRPPPIPAAALLQAARRLMRPLVRLMMQNGLTFPVLAESLRRLYVEIAVSDLLTDSKARTDSRISLLTGVHRKEIRRLRAMPPDPMEAPGVVTQVSQIVARWVGAAPFIDASGRPLPLPRARRNGADPVPSFDELVASVTSDIRSRAVLENLLGHGVVVVDAEDRVQLNADAFIPRPGGEEQLFYFARNLHDHFAAAVANIGSAGAAPFLDRSVHYDRLTPSQLQTLREYARAAGMRVMRDVNRRAQELTDATQPVDARESGRINFGVYVFDEIERPKASVAS